MKTRPFPIRIVIADDSPSARLLLSSILADEADIEVVGEASDGKEAVEIATATRPDVILMDGHMPTVDGFAAARRIMETSPTRIIIVTGSHHLEDVHTSMQALEAGALAVVEKPIGPGRVQHDEAIAQFLGTIRALSEVSVVRRWARTAAAPSEPMAKAGKARPRVLAIAGSTGAPKVIASILAEFDAGITCPVAIVQHISPGFVNGFTAWLDGLCPLTVEVATHREPMRPGHAYVAPEGYHLCVGPHGLLELCSEPAVGNFRPSADRLFESVAEAYGEAAIGVLLTGMGRDGAAGLLQMAQAGAVTVVQDPATCVVPGMPLAAIKNGAARHVIAGNAIGRFLLKDLTRTETTEDEH